MRSSNIGHWSPSDSGNVEETISPWSKETAQHSTSALIVAMAFQIYAFIAESNDPTDLGNKYPSLTILVLMIVNKFV